MLMKTLHSIIKWTVRAINYQDFWGNFTHLSCGLAGCGPQYKMILTSLLYTKYTAYQRTERPPPPALKKNPTHTKKKKPTHPRAQTHSVNEALPAGTSTFTDELSCSAFSSKLQLLSLDPESVSEEQSWGRRLQAPLRHMTQMPLSVQNIQVSRSQIEQ